jgi:hypothetical protein
MHVTREKIWQCFLLHSFLFVVLLPKICKTKTGIKVKLIISSPSATRGQFSSHHGWFNSLLFPNPLKGLCTFCRIKTQCLQIYIKLTLFEANDSSKLPLKYYVLRGYSFWEISKTMSWKNVFTF